VQVVRKNDAERADGRQDGRSAEDTVAGRTRFGHERHAGTCRLAGVAHAHGERKSALVEDVETDAQLVPGLRHRRDVARHLDVHVTTFRNLRKHRWTRTTRHSLERISPANDVVKLLLLSKAQTSLVRFVVVLLYNKLYNKSTTSLRQIDKSTTHIRKKIEASTQLTRVNLTIYCYRDYFLGPLFMLRLASPIVTFTALCQWLIPALLSMSQLHTLYYSDYSLCILSELVSCINKINN